MEFSKKFILCAIAGGLLIFGGLLLPAHMQAVDTAVLEAAGRNTPELIDHGLDAAGRKNAGAARLILEAARASDVPGHERLAAAVSVLEPGDSVESMTQFAARTANRQKILERLQASERPEVQALLRFRSRTNTAIFSPSTSSSGQALDIAIAVTGWMMDEDRMGAGLKSEFIELAAEANRGGDTQRFEQGLLDVMALGQRFGRDELPVFIARMDSVETLRLIANHVRQNEGGLPVIFSAVLLSGKPRGVAEYLLTFSRTGMGDLGSALKFHAGGVNELLRRSVRITESRLPRVGAEFSLRAPVITLTVKWILYFAGGFLLAVSMHFARTVPMRERPLVVRGFHVVREILFAVGFVVVLLLFSEPFLASESQKMEMPFKLRLPMVGDAASTAGDAAKSGTFFMEKPSLLTFLLFFVIQGLIYTACLVKLAEIRRQQAPPRIKLKLLDNEEHLFDAGLYLGFVGTIISLILVSLGIVHQSLMAAYSSTSFGIIFVSAFKIFSLRPMRRKLLLEAEGADSVETSGAAAGYSAQRAS